MSFSFNLLVPFNVHLFTFSSHSLSVSLTKEIRSNFTTLSCYLSSTDKDLSLCQHPAASYELSHSRWQGLLTCPSITARCSMASLGVCMFISNYRGGVETETSCVRLKLSWHEFDRESTTASELNLFNMSAGHTIQCNFTRALLRLYSAS